MKDKILAHLDHPGQLEKMYRTNKQLFRRGFSAIYPQVKGTALADFWNERLSYENDEIQWGTTRELAVIIFGCLIAGFLAKLPAIFGLNEEQFYMRNIGFILFPILTAYFAWKNLLAGSKVVFLILVNLAGLIFINLLPGTENEDTLILSCIHLVLLLWFLCGVAFVGNLRNEGAVLQDANGRRLAFLKYNGDLVVITTLIVIAAGILTGITIGLFSIIGFQIENFYFENIVIFGLPAAPIVGTWLIQINPQLVGKVSPVIAKIFSPLVLIMLIIYLVALLYSGKDPYNDRDFLLIFNGLLIGVMAIIFFSIAESSVSHRSYAEIWVLVLLSILTAVVNGIALSAILFRILEGGITPNRMAVVGSNVLVLINLLLVIGELLKLISKKSDLGSARNAIASFLPVYMAWTAIVTFVFPLIFSFM